MGVSPEQREIDRKARELKLQEDRLERRLEQQQRQEDKLSQGQEKVSQREKAIAEKDKELKSREEQLVQQLEQLQSEQAKNTGEMQAFQQARKRRLSFMLPILLLAGAGAGYLTYDYYAKNDVFALRLSQANSNVNKLSDVLTKAEDLKAATLQKLSLKEDELTRKQSEFETLKIAYSALEKEKSSSESSLSELEASKKALEASVETLTAEKEAMLQTVKKLEIALAESTEQLNDSTTLMASMTKESEQLNVIQAETEAALAALKKREEELIVELEEKTGVLIASKQAIDERDKIIDAKVQRQSELELQLATLQEQHELLNANRDELAAKLGEMNLSIEAVTSELTEGQQAASDKDEEIKVKLEEIASLEALVKAEKDQRVALEAKIEALQSSSDNVKASAP